MYDMVLTLSNDIGSLKRDDEDDKTSGMWGAPICLFCNTSSRLNGSLYGRGWVGGAVCGIIGRSFPWLIDPLGTSFTNFQADEDGIKNRSISLGWICEGSPSNLLKIKLTHISLIFLWRENFNLLKSTNSLYRWRKSARVDKLSF